MSKNMNQFLGLNSFGKREDGTEMTHEEKYTTIVNAIGLNAFIPCIPATKEQIQEALKTDEHLNNIPLKKWDNMHCSVGYLFNAKLGINTYSLSQTVCALKQAASMWANETEVK